MSRKKIQPLAVGAWNKEKTEFTLLEEQPIEPITQLAEMVKWTKDTYKEPGEYEFIRMLPGSLRVYEQLQFDYSE